MVKRGLLTAAICAAVAGLSAVPALAGEVTGVDGKATKGPANANSICVFSGKNDNPGGSLEDGPGGQSQSYGQENRLGLVDPHLFNPGDACRGGSNFARVDK